MKLYLVRHGEAVADLIDPARPLSPKGNAEVCRVAEFLKTSNISVECIWHSTKLRARQTAELLAQAVAQKPRLQERKGLSPNDPVEELEQALAGQRQDLMIVGHLPLLAELASLLLAGDPVIRHTAFPPAGVVCLERPGRGAWQVRWMVTPELLDSKEGRH